MTVIDIAEVVYDDDSWLAYFTALNDAAPRYLSAFSRVLGVESTSPSTVAAAPALTRPGPAHQVQLEPLAVQVLHGLEAPVPGGNVNDRVAAYVADNPKLRFWAGVDLAGDPLKEARRCVEHLGATGLGVIPFLSASDLTAPSFAPLLSYAASARLPLWVHCGQHFRSDWPVVLNGPAVLDVLAGRYPDLVLIAGHGGWPWVDEMLAVAARHDNVYLEISSHRPALLGSSFAALYSGVHPVAGRRVLFGSTTWTQGQTARALADAIPGDPTLVRRWTYDNAAALLAASAAPRSASSSSEAMS